MLGFYNQPTGSSPLTFRHVSRWATAAAVVSVRRTQEMSTGDLFKCEVTRTKIPHVRAPEVHLRLLIPKDVRKRLVIRENDFADKL